MELPSAIITLGTIGPKDSGAVFRRKKPEPLGVWACLAVNPLDMPRTPYWVSEKKHSQQPTTPDHPTLAPSSLNHTSMDCIVFIILQCHLNDH